MILICNILSVRTCSTTFIRYSYLAAVPVYRNYGLESILRAIVLRRNPSYNWGVMAFGAPDRLAATPHSSSTPARQRHRAGAIDPRSLSVLAALLLALVATVAISLSSRLEPLDTHARQQTMHQQQPDTALAKTAKGFLDGGIADAMAAYDQPLTPTPKRQPFGGRSAGIRLGNCTWTTVEDCESYASSLRALVFQKVTVAGAAQCWAYARGKESGKSNPTDCWQAGTSMGSTSWSGGNVGLPIKAVGSGENVPPTPWTDVASCEAYAISNDAWYFQHADTNCYVCESLSSLVTERSARDRCTRSSLRS